MRKRMKYLSMVFCYMDYKNIIFSLSLLLFIACSTGSKVIVSDSNFRDKIKISTIETEKFYVLKEPKIDKLLESRNPRLEILKPLDMKKISLSLKAHEIRQNNSYYEKEDQPFKGLRPFLLLAAAEITKQYGCYMFIELPNCPSASVTNMGGYTGSLVAPNYNVITNSKIVGNSIYSSSSISASPTVGSTGLMEERKMEILIVPDFYNDLLTEKKVLRSDDVSYNRNFEYERAQKEKFIERYYIFYLRGPKDPAKPKKLAVSCDGMFFNLDGVDLYDANRVIDAINSVYNIPTIKNDKKYKVEVKPEPVYSVDELLNGK